MKVVLIAPGGTEVVSSFNIVHIVITYLQTKLFHKPPKFRDNLIFYCDFILYFVVSMRVEINYPDLEGIIICSGQEIF